MLNHLKLPLEHTFVVDMIIILFFSFYIVPTKPINLRASNLSSHQLNVSWNEPERRNGIITDYTVYYKLLRNDKNEIVSGTTWETEVIAGNKTTVVLKNLRKCFN